MPSAIDAPALLVDLLARPFPAEPDPPHPHYTFDAYCEFLVNAPRRLISIVDAGYYDPLQYEPGEEPDPIDLELQYEHLFAEAITAVARHWGEATFLGSSLLFSRLTNVAPGDPDGADYALFDETVFNFDVAQVAFWRSPSGHEGRIAFIHFAVQYGDGDIQLSVCACVVLDDR
jgi:hypothetical protein